jgi:hypothetical protein
MWRRKPDDKPALIRLAASTDCAESFAMRPERVGSPSWTGLRNRGERHGLGRDARAHARRTAQGGVVTVIFRPLLQVNRPLEGQLGESRKT